MGRQDVPDRNAEGRPGKLDEGEHIDYMNEGIRNFKIEEVATMNRWCDRAILDRVLPA